MKWLSVRSERAVYAGCSGVAVARVQSRIYGTRLLYRPDGEDFTIDQMLVGCEIKIGSSVFASTFKSKRDSELDGVEFEIGHIYPGCDVAVSVTNNTAGAALFELAIGYEEVDDNGMPVRKGRCVHGILDRHVCFGCIGSRGTLG